MKISVIFGVSQMSLGIILKAFNACYFKRRLELVFEVIPQITMLWVLFGFMNVLIVWKWLMPWNFDGITPEN